MIVRARQIGWWLVLAIAAVCPACLYASAPAPQVVDFGSVAVHGTGVSSTITFTLSGLSASPIASTSGSDFGSGNLSCNAGFSTCTVNTAFNPVTAGLRRGAVVVKNAAGTVVAMAFLRGNGTAPLARFLPARIATLSGNGNDAYVDSPSSASASFSNPQGVAVDAQGDVYVADATNQVIRKIAPGGGAVSTVGGNGIAGHSGDGGAALQASLNTPTGVAVDSAGNLYIADQGNSLIRRVDATTGNITTVAGGGNGSGGTDALGDGLSATSAILSGCSAVAVDTSGNLYIADSFHNVVRKVSATNGTITLFAGGGYAAGTDGFGNGTAATSVSLNNPSGLVIDSAGNVYIADTGHSLVRMVNATSGVMSDIAGNGAYGYSGDGEAASAASFGQPVGLALDAAGDVYISDFAYSVVRMVNASTGLVSTVAGNGTGNYSGDGYAATLATMDNPSGVSFDQAGNLVIADYSNHVIRQLSFSTPSVAFPSTNIGLTSTSMISLVNLGNASLTLSSLNFSSEFQQNLTGSSDCGSNSVIAADGSCVLSINFTPTASGTVTGSATVGSNSLDTATTSTIGLSGLGISGTPALTLSASTLTFATQAVGSSSSAQNIVLTNSGAGALSISSILLGGNNTTDYSVSSTCPSSLAASSNCTISVTFVPQMSGTRTASLILNDSAAHSPQSVALTGVASGGSSFAVNTTSVAFGSQIVATTSSTQTITLANSGSSAVNITSLALSGTNAGDYLIPTTTCGSVLAASTSCTVGLQFLPSAVGARSATFLVGFSPGVSPLSVALSGTGVMPGMSVTPAAPLFGSQALGNPGAPVTITLTNSAASVISISSITLSGTNVSEFAITANNCTGTLTANSCLLSIVFTPEANGTRSATLTINNNGATPVVTVPLSGTVAQPPAPGTLFYVGSDACIHQTFNSQTLWLDANLMASAQSGTWVAPGSSLAKSGISTYYIANDQDIHQMFWGGTKYLDANLMASSQSGLTAEPGVGVTLVGTSPSIFYVASDLNIHQMFWGGTKYLDANLMASSQSGYFVEPSTGISADANGAIYYVATDQTIHLMFWTGTKYADANVMASSQSGGLVEAGLSVVVDNSGVMYYVSADQTIHQVFWGGTKYLDANLMASSQSGQLVFPGTNITIDSNDDVYYVSTGQTIHKLFWGGTKYLDSDLMAAAQSSARVQPGTGVLLDGSGNVYYLATDQTLHVNWWNGFETVDAQMLNSAAQPDLAASTLAIQGTITSGGKPLVGAKVSLSGTRSFATVTDSSGNYTFWVPTGGNYSVRPSLAGYTFSTAAQKITNLNSNQVVNFSAVGN